MTIPTLPGTYSAESTQIYSVDRMTARPRAHRMGVNGATRSARTAE